MEASQELNEQIAELAKACGCSVADMRLMAIGTTREIEAIRSADYFLAHPEMQSELCVIGLEEHTKKFEHFVGAYRSYGDFRETVRNYIFEEIAA